MNDDEDTEDVFLTHLNEEGEIVFNLVWDSGGPLPGAGHELIYRLDDGKYWRRRPADHQHVHRFVVR